MVPKIGSALLLREGGRRKGKEEREGDEGRRRRKA